MSPRILLPIREDCGANTEKRIWIFFKNLHQRLRFFWKEETQSFSSYISYLINMHWRSDPLSWIAIAFHAFIQYQWGKEEASEPFAGSYLTSTTPLPWSLTLLDNYDDFWKHLKTSPLTRMAKNPTVPYFKPSYFTSLQQNLSCVKWRSWTPPVLKPYGVVKICLVLRELRHAMFSLTTENVMVSVALFFRPLSFLILSLSALSAAFLQYFPVKMSINLAWGCSIVLGFQVAPYLRSAALTLNATGLAKCGNWHDSSHTGNAWSWSWELCSQKSR